jgi:hypothetical protein
MKQMLFTDDNDISLLDFKQFKKNYAYNPSDSGGKDQEDLHSKAAWANSS